MSEKQYWDGFNAGQLGGWSDGSPHGEMGRIMGEQQQATQTSTLPSDSFGPAASSLALGSPMTEKEEEFYRVLGWATSGVLTVFALIGLYAWASNEYHEAQSAYTRPGTSSGEDVMRNNQEVYVGSVSKGRHSSPAPSGP